MDEYIKREDALSVAHKIGKKEYDWGNVSNAAIVMVVEDELRAIPAADVRPVVTCADCKYNNACLTQAFVEDASRVPFDRNTFFCADGKRDDDA